MAAQSVTKGLNETEACEQVDLYRVFAFAFGLPSREKFDWFCRPDFVASIERLWVAQQCPGEFPGAGTFADFGDYESAYIALFDVGVPEPPVPLVESAHDKAIPAQQTALENIQFYEVLGLKHNPRRYAPDHLVTQLEFLSALRFARENAADPENLRSLTRMERDFLERHLLNWLPAAQKKLDRVGPPLFPVLLSLLLTFLRERHQSLAVA